MPDILASFDYYHRAVGAPVVNGKVLVDYSSPRYHDVTGFDPWPIMLPSFCEPIATTNQYLDFAQLSPGMTAFDLGAYSGLTSILFSQAVGSAGMVVAVEADPLNLQCCLININRYQRHFETEIKLLEGAVWNHGHGIEFSCEGNMGGGAGSMVGRARGELRKVGTFTLSDIARQANVTAVDFIKCDIEGGEAVIFEDAEFFESFRPRLIVEPHDVNGRLSTQKVVSDLSRYGYTCTEVRQIGASVPLIHCVP